jgi:hypothetical protein
VSQQTSVEARLQRLEDIEQITRLFHSYRMLLDTKQFEAVSQLFSEDAKFINAVTIPFDPDEVQEEDEDHIVVHEVEGSENIRLMFEDMARRNGREHKGDDLHHFVDPIIELDGDTATVNLAWSHFAKNEIGAPQLQMCGHHEDICVRSETGWKIHEVRAFVDMYPPRG